MWTVIKKIVAEKQLTIHPFKVLFNFALKKEIEGLKETSKTNKRKEIQQKENTSNKTRIYYCNKCYKPKKGHICV